MVLHYSERLFFIYLTARIIEILNSLLLFQQPPLSKGEPSTKDQPVKRLPEWLESETGVSWDLELGSLGTLIRL